MNLRQTTRAIQRHLNQSLGMTLKVDGVWGPNTAAAIHTLLVADIDTWDDDTPERDAPFDDRTERNLATLDPGALRVIRPFVRRAIAVAATMGCDARVICGRRDRAAQEKAKRDGASRASYGYSWHNYGAAIDFGLFRGRSYLDAADPDFAWTVYSALGELAAGFRMEWGGSWESIIDSPHFHPAGLGTTPTAADRSALARGNWTYQGRA